MVECFASLPKNVELILTCLVTETIETHVHTLQLIFLHLSFMRTVATLLSNWRGTGPYVCPISSRARMLGTKYFPLMSPVPVSASWAKDITASRIFDIMRIRAL